MPPVSFSGFVPRTRIRISEISSGRKISSISKTSPGFADAEEAAGECRIDWDRDGILCVTGDELRLSECILCLDKTRRCTRSEGIVFAGTFIR